MGSDDPIRRSLSELTDQQRDEAMDRFAVLRPFLEEDVPLVRSAGEAAVPIRTAHWSDDALALREPGEPIGDASLYCESCRVGGQGRSCRTHAVDEGNHRLQPCREAG